MSDGGYQESEGVDICVLGGQISKPSLLESMIVHPQIPPSHEIQEKPSFRMVISSLVVV